MTLTADVLTVKIRLGSGVSAVAWMSDDCSQATDDFVHLPNKSYILTGSGCYQIPLKLSPARDMSHVCIRSSDGRLSDSVPLGH